MLLEEMIIEDMIAEGLNPKKPCDILLFWSRRIY